MIDFNNIETYSCHHKHDAKISVTNHVEQAFAPVNNGFAGDVLRIRNLVDIIFVALDGSWHLNEYSYTTPC